MKKIEAIEYLVANNVYQDEWSGAGMYHAVEDIIESKDVDFSKEYLDELLKKAENSNKY